MQKQACHARYGFLTLAVWVCLAPPQAQAQTLTEDDTLTFGHVVMRDNSAPKDIELHPDGSYTADPAYIFYAEEPQLGRYTIQGQLANHQMDITIDVAATVISTGGTPNFTLVNPFTVPAIVITNGLGNATFEVGATLRSNGDGQVFQDANYLGNFDITVVPD